MLPENSIYIIESDLLKKDTKAGKQETKTEEPAKSKEYDHAELKLEE